jgi:hypothetical protein
MGEERKEVDGSDIVVHVVSIPALFRKTLPNVDFFLINCVWNGYKVSV